MTLRAIVAEDEAPQRDELCAMLAAAWPELDIVARCEDGDAALEALAEHEPQVVFLDIRMPGASGLDVARAASGRAHVVFTTAYAEHAIAAFEQGAVDYLLKPVRRDRLELAVQRLRERVANAAPDLAAVIATLRERAEPRNPSALRWITASVGDIVKLFPIEDVLLFRADDKYTRVVTRDAEAHIRTSIRELASTLDPDAFWQLHRGAIVRASAIAHVKRDELGRTYATLRGVDETVPVSQAYAFRFRAM